MSGSRSNSVRTLRAVAPIPLPLEARSDDELMTLAAGEHRAAFEVLVLRWLARVTQYCAKFVGSVQAGEELAQEVLLGCWLHRSRYRARGRLQEFLFTLARNRCLNHVRSERRRRPWNTGNADATAARAAAGTDARDQIDALLERERERQLRAALLELTPKLREAVLLRFDAGLGYPEIARIVRRPESTVRSRVFLAMQRLREALAGDLDR